MKKTTKKAPKSGGAGSRTTGGSTWRQTFKNTKWIVGVITVFTGMFLLLAVGVSFFSLKHDVAILQGVPTDNPTIVHELSNMCGTFGAKVGWWLVTRSFGLCGIIIPIIIMLLGAGLIASFSRKLNHLMTSLAFVALVGSLTLGLAFGTKWDMFGSGIGGGYGIELASLLTRYIGLGAWIVVLAAWIMVGIYMNVHFIEFLNRKSEQLFEKFQALVVKIRAAHAARVARAAEDAVVVEDVEQEQEEKPEEQEQEEEEPVEEEVVNEPPVEEPPIEEEMTEETTEETAEEPAEESEELAEEVVIDVEEHHDALVSEEEANRRPFNPDSTPNYKFPQVEMLEEYRSKSGVSDEEIISNKKQIEDTLGDFGIPIREMRATIGPTVTLYEIVQAQGVKIARVQGLENDIAQSLKAKSGIRIIAPMPGRGTIGIEVPNRNCEIVSMRSSIQSEVFQNFKAELPVVIGRTIQNENYVFDLADMPHLLVAGATGQGKSVGLNAIIASLLYRKDPMQLKFVLIDPKMVEFSLYKRLERHFLAKMESEDEAIITDSKKAVCTLNALCIEMESRLRKCGEAGVRNIKEYNEKVRQREIDATDIMPYIVVVIDEFADLITVEKGVELPVMRLAAKARAIGIHLIVATQRPDVKVITGTIKANFPARIAFRVQQMTDSRTILDQPGANLLIGRGDMLLSKGGQLTRIQCALIETKEVNRIVDYVAAQAAPLNGCYLLPDFADNGNGGGGGGADVSSNDSTPVMGSEGGAAQRYDPFFADIARDAVTSGTMSVSYMQRTYAVGFNRAGRIMAQLEKAGIVGKQSGSQKRDVKFYDLQSLEAYLQELGV